MRNTLSIRFAASEPAINKALQEVRVLGGFGLLVADAVSTRAATQAVRFFFQKSSYAYSRRSEVDLLSPGLGGSFNP
jgi:hypothetical protein